MHLVPYKGYAAPEVGNAYARAQELCRNENTAILSSVLRGLWQFSFIRGKLHTALDFSNQLLHHASRKQDPLLLLSAHSTLGLVLFHRGELAVARHHLEQGIALHNQYPTPSRGAVQSP